ncbi:MULTISPECIES: cytochrome c oxidase subunit 3 [Acidobacteriaceae]|uniref:cytochrome c oxidase subunit 3 n=1 Tax=Acidobacteriaceae TaxID=204434 RepID=UPI00131BC68C|nr:MULTISPECIES: cytochrome c oxidase subunit 3 [Acidobacteriaceae]MDW5265303.1 cytochrome c oxidase subunit 3 [Edaphobacter sp.]
MPTTITPTKTEPKPRRQLEDHDHGSGRRPPTDKRTGGGGDNDNWNDRPNGRRGPRERLVRYRMGIFFALASDLMFFVAIVSTFFVSQSTGHFDAYNNYVNEWSPTLIPPILWLNTAVLILSSITMETARRRMFHEVDVMDEWLGLGKPITRAAIPWVAATVVLGIVFLIGQWIAWTQLATQHVFFLSNPSSHFFYLITGVHGIHLILGIFGLAAALVGLYVSRSLETRQIMVDCAAWYWHSMGIFWLFLFTLLVFFQ